MTKNKILLFLLIFVFGIGVSYAQFIEDAVRYSQPNGIITPRSAGLGIAYLGIADDYAALFFNPAGLSLVPKTELSVGLGFQRNSNAVKFENLTTNFSANDAFFSHVGLVAPFKTDLGNAAVGLGYVLESNYNNTYEYSGFNAKNTMISNQANFGTRNYQDNWAYHIWLANQDLKTPIVDSLTQQAYITEKGGLHDVIGGVAFDVSPSVSVGLNIMGKFGSYNYTRNYSEYDVFDKYNKFDTLTWSNLDFNTLYIDENIKQQIAGITGSLGIQGRISDFMRIGVTVKFPTYYQIDEDYGIYARSKFDDGWEPNPYDPDEPSAISYKITSPFIYSAGMSFYAKGLVFTAGIEYLDATQLSFSDANGDEVTNIDEIRRYFDRLNQDITRELVGQVTWGFGAEWDIPAVPVVVRGSFQSTTSPYSVDVPKASTVGFALGGGIYLASNVRLDAVFAWNSQNQVRTNYGTGDNASYYELTTNPLNIGMEFTFRF
jgi:hypothetical protein